MYSKSDKNLQKLIFFMIKLPINFASRQFLTLGLDTSSRAIWIQIRRLKCKTFERLKSENI